MFEFLIVSGDKRLGSDDAGVGKVSGTIGKPVDFTQFKIPLPLFFNDLFVKLNPFFRLYGTAFIQKPAVFSESLGCIGNTELL